MSLDKSKLPQEIIDGVEFDDRIRGQMLLKFWGDSGKEIEPYKLELPIFEAWGHWGKIHREYLG